MPSLKIQSDDQSSVEHTHTPHPLNFSWVKKKPVHFGNYCMKLTFEIENGLDVFVSNSIIKFWLFNITL